MRAARAVQEEQSHPRGRKPVMVTSPAHVLVLKINLAIWCRHSQSLENGNEGKRTEYERIHRVMPSTAS